MKKLLPVFFALLILSSCKEKEVAVESVTIDPGASTSLRLGETLQLIATVLPDKASSKTVTWSSSKPSTATISVGGLVTPVAEGETIIFASAGGITAKCTVTVLSKFVLLTALSFNPDKLGIVINTKKTLEPLFAPVGASDKTVEWKSNKEDIATVSNNGEVEAKKLGICTITAKSSKYPAINGTCEITVVAAAIPLTGLTISPLEKTMEVGDTFQLQHGILPNNAATNTEVTFVSSDETKATVTETGRVTALAITSTPPPPYHHGKKQG